MTYEKQLTDDIRDINLGYLQIADWDSTQDSIWPKWMQEDPEYKNEIQRNGETNRVVWYGEDLEVTINYPLSKDYTFRVSGPLTRQQLAAEVQKHYKKIYKNPEQWGVWGHDIGDLILHTLYVYKDGKAKVGVDS
jgi:hypothetical protein